MEKAARLKFFTKKAAFKKVLCIVDLLSVERF